MDLSKLSSDLPPASAVNQASVDDLNRELTSEFKNAAKSVATLYNSSGNPSVQKAEFANAARSVTSLYRLTTGATSLMHHSGYLSCLDDLLEVITNDGDIENWALTRRAEITNNTDGEGTSTTEKSEKAEKETDTKGSKNYKDKTISLQEGLPQDFKFSFALELQAPHNFNPSFPPLSVERTARYGRDRVKDKEINAAKGIVEENEEPIVKKPKLMNEERKGWKRRVTSDESD